MPRIRRLRGRGHGLSGELRFLEAICLPDDFGKQIIGCPNVPQAVTSGSQSTVFLDRLSEMKNVGVIGCEMHRHTLASRHEVLLCSTPLR